MNGKLDALLMVVDVGLARAIGEFGAEALEVFGLVVSDRASPVKA